MSVLLSIVVPVLNERDLVVAFLAHLRQIAPKAEIIVVDGGSVDGTDVLAAPLADAVLKTHRGRARQMNAGAAAAHGDVLCFLHADSTPPANFVRDIDRALGDPQTVGGCFRLRIASSASIYRISDSLGNVAVDIFGFALGDHGLFCRRVAFENAGGYPDIPILEDAELFRRLARLGRMRQVRSRIISSPRTFERAGRYRTTATYFLILALYVLRVRVAFLYAIYARLHGRRQGVL